MGTTQSGMPAFTGVSYVRAAAPARLTRRNGSGTLPWLGSPCKEGLRYRDWRSSRSAGPVRRASCAAYQHPIKWDAEAAKGIRIGSYPPTDLFPKQANTESFVDGCLTEFRKRMIPREIHEHMALFDAQLVADRRPGGEAPG